MKEVYRKKTGNMEQLAYVRRVVYEEGLAGGLHAFQVKNGPLYFTAGLDKCLDIAELSWRGNQISFLSKPGLQGRQHYDTNGFEAQKSIMGGLFFTCGTNNVGTPSVDPEAPLSMHGTMRSTAAEHVCADAHWEDGEYVLEIGGQMRQAQLFGENIVLRRKIRTVYGQSRIRIHDEFENQGFRPEPFMLLYHFNIGYPMLDAGAEVQIPSVKACLRGEETETELPWKEVSEPVNRKPEEVFFHTMHADSDGKVRVRVQNQELRTAFTLVYDPVQLPNFAQWKSMASGDYVLGLEPCNCHVNGQKWEREQGNLAVLAPGERKEVDLEIVLEDLPAEQKPLD
ncbi:MAG: aldose 1-epimerase family protein [Candidatus Limivivens sp.]|nr:aldose 1-epimerase family protein [Candidatus Limivivens sp.]